MMGRRYSAILRHLGHTVDAVDIGDAIRVGWDHAIVATPTETHSEVLTQLACQPPTKRRSVLMEKPLAKSIGDTERMFLAAEETDIDLYCVNQYGHLPEAQSFIFRKDMASSYDYYNSGKDGLVWDCFQIFALASDTVTLKNDSPWWKCTINGERLSSANMDIAYVRMVEDFLGLKRRVWGREIVLKTTARILEYLK